MLTPDQPPRPDKLATYEIYWDHEFSSPPSIYDEFITALLEKRIMSNWSPSKFNYLFSPYSSNSTNPPDQPFELTAQDIVFVMFKSVDILHNQDRGYTLFRFHARILTP